MGATAEVVDTDLSAFGARLCQIAESRGFKRRGLAARLAKICDVTDKAAYKWVSGEAIPQLPKLNKLAAALGTSPMHLLFGEDALGLQQVASLPAQLCLINGLYQAGELDEADLGLIEDLARLLASKNSHRGAVSQSADED